MVTVWNYVLTNNECGEKCQPCLRHVFGIDDTAHDDPSLRGVVLPQRVALRARPPPCLTRCVCVCA